MKVIERKLTKAQIITICLLIVSLLFTGAYFVISGIAKKRAANQTTETSTVTLDLKEGESSYLNRPIAYPRVEESEMLLIEITNNDEKFGVSRYPDDNGNFLFHYYEDGNEKAIPFLPAIANAEGEFNYESLYAIENSDGFGRIYCLTYLCSAIGAPYFTERIELPATDTPEGMDKYNEMLKEYGFTKSNSTMISFGFAKRDPETKEIIKDTSDGHVVLVGGKAVSGTGYYFMVDDRNYIYYTSSEYFKYALGGFASFVNGRLVAEGLSNDKGYSPYLTTDFKTWTGTTFGPKEDPNADPYKVFTNDMAGYEKYENPIVIANGNYKETAEKDGEGAAEFSGYYVENNKPLKFDLQSLLDSHPEKDRIKAALVGKPVGMQSSSIILTLLKEVYSADNKYINFGESNVVTYNYVISKIEAVLNGNSERTDGTVGQADTLLKLTYQYTGGGKSSNHDCHAVINITNLPTTERDKFIGQPVGTLLDAPLTISVDYTNQDTAEAKGSLKSNEKFVLVEILSIFGKDGELTDVITEDTYVNVSYYVEIDGKQGSISTTLIKMSDVKEGDKLYPIKSLILEKGKGVYNQTVYDKEYRYEFMREFTTYEIEEIEYFVANEMIVSFEFVNASERDPFYGDTFYRNTLTNDYKLYGLNSGTCEAAVELLGGVGANGSNSTGFSGQTVAVGLSLENMKKYGLFAHKIYFEMPRGLYDKSESDGTSEDDALSDFGWLSTIGFTLYISDADYDENGTKFRYIGSDMYDIIAKVDSDQFDFVEYGFVEFWARKNMVMMNVKQLEELKLEFNMSDLQGSYSFDISFKECYDAYIDGKYIVSDTYIKGYSPVTQQVVRVKASENAFNTAFKTKFGAESWGNLALLYDDTMGGGQTSYYPDSKDTYGAGYFNTVYETLQLTSYLDNFDVSQEQLDEWKYGNESEGIAAKPRVMRMHLKIEGADEYYTYDFYRIDDRRIMVSLYRSDANGNKIAEYGEVSDFYITTYAFKKLVNNYIYLLDGKPIDKTVGYHEVGAN